MFDFDFHNPTRILFGRGRETEIGRQLAAAGHRRVLFVYGQGSIRQNNLYDRIVDSLQKHHIQWLELGGVVSNPLLSHVRQGIALAKEENIDGLLAVGGGSVLDEAKAIAVGALATEDIWQYYLGLEVTAALPLFTVLTLAATGSEMNGNSVITNDDTRQKYSLSSPHIYPRLSILNPELTCSVPPDYSAFAAVDAIAHVIEAYFTKENSTARLQDRLVEGIVRTVITTQNTIREEPANYAARAEFMWAATLALNGLTVAGVAGHGFPNHMIEHSLSALYNIAHGAGLAIVIPAWMKWYSSRQPARFQRFARKIFGEETAAAGITALETWFTAIKTPVRLSDAGIPVADIDRIADNASGLAVLWGLDKDYPKETIVEILQLAA